MLHDRVQSLAGVDPGSNLIRVQVAIRAYRPTFLFKINSRTCTAIWQVRVMNLHWLPVRARIDFKILLFTWKALNNSAPIYIKNMLEIREETRNLRNPINLYLKVPKCNRITLGGNAFSTVAPVLWNQLPIEIRVTKSENIFRKLLKTFV